MLMLMVTTKERKMLLPSLRISSSITLQFLFVKSHRWISNRFVVYVFVINFAITFFPVVCLSHLCPIQRWSSITAKLEISAKSWLPSKSQFRSWSGVWPAPKMEFFRERKMLNGEVSALHAAVDEVIKFVAWHWAPSPWHLVSIEFPPINISLCFLKTKSKVFKSHNIISPPSHIVLVTSQSKHQRLLWEMQKRSFETSKAFAAGWSGILGKSGSRRW